MVNKSEKIQCFVYSTILPIARHKIVQKVVQNLVEDVLSVYMS